MVEYIEDIPEWILILIVGVFTAVGALKAYNQDRKDKLLLIALIVPLVASILQAVQTVKDFPRHIDNASRQRIYNDTLGFSVQELKLFHNGDPETKSLLVDIANSLEKKWNIALVGYNITDCKNADVYIEYSKDQELSAVALVTALTKETNLKIVSSLTKKDGHFISVDVLPKKCRDM